MWLKYNKFHQEVSIRNKLTEVNFHFLQQMEISESTLCVTFCQTDEIVDFECTKFPVIVFTVIRKTQKDYQNAYELYISRNSFDCHFNSVNSELRIWK